MALTEEQIKNLKPGDTIFLNNYPLTFRDSNIHGDVLARDNVAECNEGGICWFSKNYLSIDNATPKYDPCRLFKKGDKVRVVAWNGRDIARIGQIGRVVSDEYNSRVELAIDGWTSSVYYPACHLELVTPVEELEPYELVETTDYWSVEKENEELCLFWKKHHHNAKESAEAERDRLNAEWRKEQKHD